MSLTNPQIRKLKGMAQKLEPLLTVGKAGLSDGFIRSLDEVLESHELVKVKFGEFKKQKRELARLLAEKTQSQIVMQVGHVVVLYRRQADPKNWRIPI